MNPLLFSPTSPRTVQPAALHREPRKTTLFGIEPPAGEQEDSAEILTPLARFTQLLQTLVSAAIMVEERFSPETFMTNLAADRQGVGMRYAVEKFKIRGTRKKFTRVTIPLIKFNGDPKTYAAEIDIPKWNKVGKRIPLEKWTQFRFSENRHPAATSLNLIFTLNRRKIRRFHYIPLLKTEARALQHNVSFQQTAPVTSHPTIYLAEALRVNVFNALTHPPTPGQS